MTSEELLKEAILSQYGSVNRFAEELGIAESSIRNIFKRGIGSVNAGTLVMICKKLNVDVEALVDGTFSPRPNVLKENLYNEYVGQHNNDPINSNAPVVSDEGERDRALLSVFHKLNEEGQDRLLETADDMVRSGKYIKNNPSRLGKTEVG